MAEGGVEIIEQLGGWLRSMKSAESQVVAIANLVPSHRKAKHFTI